MERTGGLWLAFGGEGRADRIADRIESDDTFTRTVVSSDVKPRRVELALISLEGTEVNYIGVSEAGKRVATDERVIRLSNHVALPGVTLDAIRSTVPTRFQRLLELPSSGVARVTPGAFEAMLAAIVALAPAASPRLRELRVLVKATAEVGRAEDTGIDVFELDAIAAAIEVWGGSKLRKSVLRSARPASDSRAASFLGRLRHATLREDIQIGHDQGVFPGFATVARFQVGAVQFENAQGERLTIVNCNRQPLERALGVDLIYYNHRFDSFTLVQYKRMRRSPSGTVAYRSSGDRNLKPELNRMREVNRLLRCERMASAPQLRDVRLSRRPFFFKFCEARTRGPLDSSMIGGMYVPMEIVSHMLRDAKFMGGRSGITIGWDQRPRRFSNSEFTRLLRDGWIGSRGAQSTALGAVLTGILESGRALVYAASWNEGHSRDYRRDDLGRFADRDDPLAS
jgi:hypothetical protein